MIKYDLIKNQIILILFSLSIFLSFVSISYLEFRFLYLLTFFFLIYDSLFLKRIPLTIKIIAISMTLFLFCYSYLSYFFYFSEKNFFNFINYELKKDQILKILFQSMVVGLSVLIISFYEKLIISNLIKIIDYFIFIFIFLIFYYNIRNEGIMFDLLFRCELGFFYYTNYLFNESSHFIIVSAPIIVSFIYNIKIYIKKKITFTFYILFLIFVFGNFSLTFYLSLMSAIFIIFISCKNLNKLSKYLFLILLIISNIFFFKENIIPTSQHTKNLNMKNCVSTSLKKVKKYSSTNDKDWFKGNVVTNSNKLKQVFKKENHNLSVGIYIYSFYISKVSLLQYPLGVGLKNYIHFRNYFDQTLEVDWKNIMGEIKFKEKYMPILSGVILEFNLHSGSNNFSKLIVEFGLFGLFILLLVFIYCFSSKINDKVKVVLIPLIFVQLFIRGTGYFNSGFLIALIIVLILIIKLISKKYHYEIKNF
jgi:hypothetical protein